MKTNIDRVIKDIETIAGFNSTPGAGCTRFSYTEEDRQARAYLTDEFGKVGMVGSVDAVGNLRFRNPEGGKKPVIMIGSHIDTVRNGGRFDGVVGVVGGLEVARCLSESGTELPFALEVMIFSEEEGANFGSTMLGSKAMIGKFPDVGAFHSYKDENGSSWYERMKAFGLEPGTLVFHDPTEAVAMFEYHIEQGIVLERQEKKIGIVEVIAGMQTFEITVTGHSNHAGSTPMDMRNDPMTGAGEIILMIEKTAAGDVGPHTVATVGRISASPGGSNVIAESVTFSLDLRDVSDENIAEGVRLIRDRAADIAQARGLSVGFHLVGASPAVPLSGKVVRQITRQAEVMGVPFIRMNSGAVHDAAMIAQKCDVGMIFVPSRDGLSHTPGEYTSYEDIRLGCDLLLDTILNFEA